MLDQETTLKTKSAAFPSSPGVYIMRDAHGKILYVGKAKNLKSRVLSYFGTGKNRKTTLLMRKTTDIETILTSTEYEALLLENNLIKRHSPRYNINLKDGKSYPVIRITADKFPRIFRTRHIVKDGSAYYGPYPNAKTVDIYIDLIQKLFPLRRCKKLVKRNAPCLYHQIGRCSAPCIDRIDETDYGKMIKKIRTLLNGRTIGFRKEIQTKMREAATNLEFERAAEFRDALQSLELLNAEPVMMDFREKSSDYIDYAVSGEYIVFAVIQMRGGQVMDRQIFINEYAGNREEALPEFLIQYYNETGRERPGTLYIPNSPDVFIDQFFAGDEGIRIKVPEEKSDLAVLAMVKQNAGSELNRLIRQRGDIPALEGLKIVLNLPKVPRRIEGFDISQLNGKHTVASLVSFQDGRPDKAGYRHYTIRSTAGAVDDYKAIAEAVTRRYQRILSEDKESLPDLILVDGGRGQVSSALKVLKALELDDRVPLIGLAKRDEEIWLPHIAEPIRLPAGNPCLRILQHVRDETHRFATSHNKRLRSKALSLSSLEAVPGIGPAKSARLLTTYKSLEGIYDRSTDEIARTARVGNEVAETVREFLGKKLGNREITYSSSQKKSGGNIPGVPEMPENNGD